jgi:chromosome partitioning protein
LVSELGWPSGAFKRMANGLGWPKGDRGSSMVSRETARPEPTTPSSRQDWSAPDDARGAADSTGSVLDTRATGEDGSSEMQRVTAVDFTTTGSTPIAIPAPPPPYVAPQALKNVSDEKPYSSQIDDHAVWVPVAHSTVAQQAPTQHAAPPSSAAHLATPAAPSPAPSSADSSAPPPLSTPRFDTSPFEAPVAARLESNLSAPTKGSVDADLGPLDNAHLAPERQYATADALGSRADADARIFSTGLPEVRMSTSNDPPSTDTETPAISVSVTRPWLEIDPAPAFREAQRREAETSMAPAQAPPSTISPLIESISLMDDSTPLALEVAEDTRRRIALAGRRFPRPKNTRVITVSNQKGGVGKTTTTVNMAAALAQAGLRVLVLDIDPQGNASTALGIDHHAEVPSVYDVLVEGRPLDEVIQQCPDIENLWCAPATIDLAGAEIELVSLVARESRLERAVSSYLGAQDKGEERLDYILIDCPPSLGLLTVNAFVAAHEVLIPIQCEYYALEGLSQLLRNVELIRGHLNTALHVSTILLTMYDGRTRLSSQVADEVRAHFPSEVLKTTVPRSVRISEAPSHGQTVMTYDPASSGALSYLEAARELAEQVLSDGDDALPTEDRA